MRKPLLSLLAILLAAPLWADITGIVTFPGGSSGEIQFNEEGVFDGDSDFTFSTSTNRLSVSSAGVTYAEISTISAVYQIRFADGTIQTSSPTIAGAVTNVTAGYGLSGGGTGASLNLDLETNVTNYIQNGSAAQTATLNISSGSVGILHSPLGHFTTVGATTAVTQMIQTSTITINGNVVQATAGSRTLTIPDPGSNASFVMTAGSQDIGGTKNFTSNVGIGISAPEASLHIGTLSQPANHNGSLLVGKALNTGANNGHGISDISSFTGNAGTAYASFDSRFYSTGSISLDHTIAFQAAQDHQGTGTLSDMYDFGAAGGNSGGAIGERHAFYAQDMGGSGAVGTQYGLRIANLTRGTTANYGLYIEGSTPNLINGPITFASTAAFAAGSAASPAIKGPGATVTNTGIYWRAANLTGIASNGVSHMEVGGGFSIFTSTVVPSPDNTFNLGQSGNRWKEVWAGNGTIQTSSSRRKKNIREIKFTRNDKGLLVPINVIHVPESKDHVFQEGKESVVRRMGSTESYMVPRGIVFQWNSGDTTHDFIGFNGDELPLEAHALRPDGTRDPENFYANAVIGILCAKVRDLEARVAALEAQ